MARKFRVAAASVAIAAVACSALAMSPASAGTSEIQYVIPVDQAVAEVTQILASGTSVNGYTWPGTPDGLGGIKNADGTITVYVTHELSASDPFVAKTERNYGGFGSDITAVVYNPTTKKIVSAKSAIKKALWYDYTTGTYGTTPEAPEDAAGNDAFSTPNHTTAINRLCSATLVTKGQLAYKGFGINDPVFMVQEEGSDESRAFALNTKTGELAQLPALGLGGYENTNVAPAAKTGLKTVAISGEDGDSTDSQLFLYSGTKSKSGNWLKRAGLTNGSHYVAAVLNSGADVANDIAARTALAKQSITSAVRAFHVAAAKVKVVEGQLTITTAANNNLKVGDEVTLSGFEPINGVNINGKVTAESVTATSLTFGSDIANFAEASVTAGDVALNANTWVVTTAAAHGFNEGDTVNVTDVPGLNGRYTVTGAPSSTVFTFNKAAAATSFATGKVNKLLDVTFKKIPTNLAGDAQQALARLRGTEFARIEDGQFDPSNPNVYYFVTTQSDSVKAGEGPAGVLEAGRDGGAIWKLTFKNVKNPLSGAKLELVLNGTEAPANDSAVKIYKPDNITLTANGQYMMIQEDPGAVDRVSRLLALRLADNKLVAVAKFDPKYFDPTQTDSFITNDEETSGIIDATKLLAASGDTASYFLFDAQVHPMTKSGGISYGSDPLKARAVSLMRPDLIAQTSVAVTGVTATGTDAGKHKIVIKLSGVSANPSNSGAGLIVTGGTQTIDVNDVITLFGSDKSVNGSYTISSIDSTNLTVTVSVGDAIAAGEITTGANAKIVLTDPAKESALKDAIIEGGALYVLKISSWADLFA